MTASFKAHKMLDFVIFAVTFVVALLIAVIYLYPVSIHVFGGDRTVSRQNPHADQIIMTAAIYCHDAVPIYDIYILKARLNLLFPS